VEISAHRLGAAEGHPPATAEAKDDT
jgi:hypothetical protein